MPQCTIIPKTSHLLFCMHLEAGDDVLYWFLIDERDLLFCVCETCTEELVATGDVDSALMLLLADVERLRMLPSPTVH